MPFWEKEEESETRGFVVGREEKRGSGGEVPSESNWVSFGKFPRTRPFCFSTSTCSILHLPTCDSHTMFSPCTCILFNKIFSHV